jgi:hypothetical protein
MWRTLQRAEPTLMSALVRTGFSSETQEHGADNGVGTRVPERPRGSASVEPYSLEREAQAKLHNSGIAR